MAIKLADRTIWSDGSITVAPSKFMDFISTIDASKIFVDHLTPELEQYNAMSVESDTITVKDHILPYNKTWNIPAKYKKLNVLEYITDKFEEAIVADELDSDEIEVRMQRICREYHHFGKKKLMNLLRTLIYVINTFEREKVVWGPGRGSSVSSYILYIIGVHDVDSVMFGLDITDFLRDIE